MSLGRDAADAVAAIARRIVADSFIVKVICITPITLMNKIVARFTVLVNSTRTVFVL